jgi:hypothetical protein
MAGRILQGDFNSFLIKKRFLKNIIKLGWADFRIVVHTKKNTV